MYAICSTKKEDVAKCIQEMVKKGQKLPVMQFGAKKYHDLEKDQSKVVNACNEVSKESIYVINLGTRKIHKKGCAHKGKNVIGARLCNLKTTGLALCKSCMK